MFSNPTICICLTETFKSLLAEDGHSLLYVYVPVQQYMRVCSIFDKVQMSRNLKKKEMMSLPG